MTVEVGKAVAASSFGELSPCGSSPTSPKTVTTSF
jgi:hypothetical protein